MIIAMIFTFYLLFKIKTINIGYNDDTSLRPKNLIFSCEFEKFNAAFDVIIFINSITNCKVRKMEVSE